MEKNKEEKMNLQDYERIREELREEYDRKLAALELLAGVTPQQVAYKKVIAAAKPKPVAIPIPKKAVAVLNGANGTNHTEPAKDGIRVPCEIPACGKTMQKLERQCETCSKRVCSLHWNRRKKVCVECGRIE